MAKSLWRYITGPAEGEKNGPRRNVGGQSGTARGRSLRNAPSRRRLCNVQRILRQSPRRNVGGRSRRMKWCARSTTTAEPAFDSRGCRKGSVREAMKRPTGPHRPSEIRDTDCAVLLLFLLSVFPVGLVMQRVWSEDGVRFGGSRAW